ncbi:MAG: extracellular solute-binding protein, partial [Caldilineaceae bacterium]|nr:extracellular solute-binding protein [Caldilineaceae bacterium]
GGVGGEGGGGGSGAGGGGGSEEGDSGAAPAADTAASADSAPTAQAAEESSAETAADSAATTVGGQVSVYIDSDTNISDWWSNTIKPMFEAAHPEFELVIVHTGGSGGSGNGPIADRAYAALQAGEDPDVDYFETWNVLQPPGSLEAGLWQEITAENVPNIANVIEPAMRSSTGYDIPYRGSQVLFAYNADRLLMLAKEQGKVAEDATDVPEELVPSTWPELMTWVCEFPGEFIYPRPDTTGAGRNFVTRAVLEANGLNQDTFTVDAFTEQYGTEELTPEQIAEINDTYFAGAWEMLNEIEPCLYDNATYPSGAAATTRLLSDELVTLIPIWSDQALQAMSAGLLPENTRFIQLEDLPMVGGYAAAAIPTNASNLEGALTLANFLLSSEVQESVVRDIGGFPAVSWDTLPAELQEDFNDVITDNVPSFGSPWTGPMYEGWYTTVAPDVTRE